MLRNALSLYAVLLLASSAFAQSRHEDGKRHFSFPIPPGWQEASKAILADEYEKMDEGIDGLAISLTAYESNPRERRTHPTLVVRFNQMKPAEMTKMYEELKSNEKAALAAIVAAQKLPSVYKFGKITFDARKGVVRIPYSYESWNESRIELITCLMLGQFSLVTMEFRGEKDLFRQHEKAIEAAIRDFEFDRRFRIVRDEPQADTVPPPPPPPRSSAPKPFEPAAAEPESEGISSTTILAIMGAVLAVAVLALVVVKAGGDKQPARRGRGGGSRRRR